MPLTRVFMVQKFIIDWQSNETVFGMKLTSYSDRIRYANYLLVGLPEVFTLENPDKQQNDILPAIPSMEESLLQGERDGNQNDPLCEHSEEVWGKHCERGWVGILAELSEQLGTDLVLVQVRQSSN